MIPAVHTKWSTHTKAEMLSFPFPVPRGTAACAHSTVATEMTIGDCASAAPVNMTQCVGTCASNATTVFTSPYLQTNCKCCKPMSMSKKTVELHCSEYILQSIKTTCHRLNLYSHLTYFCDANFFQISTTNQFPFVCVLSGKTLSALQLVTWLVERQVWSRFNEPWLTLES